MEYEITESKCTVFAYYGGPKDDDLWSTRPKRDAFNYISTLFQSKMREGAGIAVLDSPEWKERLLRNAAEPILSRFVDEYIQPQYIGKMIYADSDKPDMEMMKELAALRAKEQYNLDLENCINKITNFLTDIIDVLNAIDDQFYYKGKGINHKISAIFEENRDNFS